MVFRKGTCLYGPSRVYQWSLGRVHAYGPGRTPMVFRKGTCLYGPGRVYQWSLGRVHAYMVQVGYTNGL